MVQVKVMLRGDKTENGALHVLHTGVYVEDKQFAKIERCGEMGLGNIVLLQCHNGAEFIGLMPEEVEFI